ncbi:MAG: hypothetical protein HYZ27_04205, partial [Deltaproteobacteria bacterium]|nr:hypothetical protein [Deltaproteobacteria bacterium]
MSSISGTDRQSVQSPGAGVGLQLPASLQQALDPQQVQRDLSTLLERAGLERAPDGTIAVKDTAALGKTGEVQGLSAREQVYGAGETQLKPPGPPRIELNKELRAGAETFARNIDVAFNNIFKKGVGASDATAPGGVTGPTTTQQDDIRRMAELSADVLLAAFLKLNISDPNNSVETHNKLHEIMTDLRQKAIDDARAKIETAQAQMKEAQEYAEKAQYVSTVLQVVMIAVTLILTAVTFGAGAVLFVAVAMVIGAMIGQMTSGDALGGASIAGSIASFGVSAAASAAAQAAQKIAEEVAKEAIKQGQAITQQTINKMVQEI